MTSYLDTFLKIYFLVVFVPITLLLSEHFYHVIIKNLLKRHKYRKSISRIAKD